MIDIRSDFIRYLKTRDIFQSSIERYVEIVDRFQRFIYETYNVRFEDDAVKGYMVSNWETSIQHLKITTRNLNLLAVRRFLKYLFLMQYVSTDLSQVLSMPKSLDHYYKIHPDERPEKTAYTLDEIKKMLEFTRSNKRTEKRTKALIITLLSSGLRISELLSLNVGDIHDDDVFVMVSRKGTHGNKVKAAIPFEARPYIKEYLESRVELGEALTEDSPLFVTAGGNRMSRNTAQIDLSRMQKKLGIATGIHTFRHTALTAAAKSANPVVSRDFAGQKNISVTNRYLHSTEDEIAEAASKIANIFISQES